MLIAHIALPIALHSLFDYQLPESLPQAQMGMRVRVPFGNRQLIGIIVSIDQHTTIESDKLKTVDQLIDNEPVFSPSIWQLLIWSAEYYHHPIGEVLFHALPTLLREGKKATFDEVKTWQLTEKGKLFNPTDLTRSAKQRQLLTHLQSNKLDSKNLWSSSVYQSLAKQGLIHQVVKTKIDISTKPISVNPSPVQLNHEQQVAINTIRQHNQQFATYLLDGITGSGKTEVYLNALADILDQGKQILILVPEIGLTPQTIARFQARFNAPIDILHSGLTEKARLHVWLRSKQGLNTIVVGTRSALFTPFKQLGMIVIDEEHDGSYKQQEGWRYHARDSAIMRAKYDNIPIILGSATPSFETLNNAQTGRYHHLKLTQRAGDAQLATHTIIDIKGLPLSAGLSQPLLDEIKKHLNNNNQVMLFLNRRGFAPLLLCHDCGWIAECPRCDRPYTYHQQQKKLICHHCDMPRSLPIQCPKCGSSHLVAMGFGTEQLETHLKLIFPNIPISRIDRDTVSKKGALAHYLQKIEQGGAHILVGTQIIAKGHHFPDVTLVGIVDVDGALFSSDFRATERFAQIYTQVAGRAGRENKKGYVVLQTHHPDHPILTTLLQQGYHAFAQQTLAERQATYLPPFSYQVLIRAADRNNIYAEQFLQKIKSFLSGTDNLWILGPMPATQPKKAGLYRWQLLLQHQQRQILHHTINQLIKQIETWPEAKNIRWSIDSDPMESY